MSTKKFIMNNKIYTRIKEIRKKIGCTQKEFADTIGISQGHLSKIERGEYIPDKPILISIAYSYRINLDWLLTGEGPMWLESPDQCERDKQDIGESIKTWIDNFLKNASEEEKHWFKIQFSKCFPDFLEWMEKRKKKY